MGRQEVSRRAAVLGALGVVGACRMCGHGPNSHAHVVVHPFRVLDADPHPECHADTGTHSDTVRDRHP